MTTTVKPLFLDEIIDGYVAWRNDRRPIGRDLRPKSVEHIRQCVQAFREYLKRRPTIGDLNPVIVNGWMKAMLDAGKSPYTVKSRRTGITVIWRYIVRVGLSEVTPADVRPVHLPKLNIHGFTADQARLMLVKAQSLTGTIRHTGIPRKIYWGSLLVTQWDFALRAGDILAMKVSNFDLKGFLWIYEHKTGKSDWHSLRPTTRDAIAACIAAAPGRELLWPGMRARSFYRAFVKLAKDSGLSGTSRFIRRGASSEVEKLRPGQGWRLLNHSTPELFEKHYRVKSIADAGAPLPPELNPKTAVTDTTSFYDEAV